MKKTALFLVSVLLVLGGAAGQNGNSTGRFEWVRGYAPGEHVSIVGSVTDSVGNLYILGSFNFESRWENGELIMPITPHNGAQNGVNTLIAKISPEGEMVWKKVIHGNYCPSQPHDIKAVGDTAFACLVTMPLASLDYYLYYLDTLIEATRTTDQTWPGYPMSAEGVDFKCLALITFDFDGNVLEQHFLQISFVDRNGEDIYYVYPPNSGQSDFLSTDVPLYPSFTIDGDGNIYLSRLLDGNVLGGPYNGEYSVSDGTISAIKFWCNRRLVGMAPADSILYGTTQIIKFSPRFDTLLRNRLLLQKGDVLIGSISYLEIDNTNKIYLNGELRPGNQGMKSKGIIPVDTIQGLSFYIDADKNDWKSIVVRFDSTLTATRLVSLEDSIIDSTRYLGIYCFNDIAFDNDSGLIVISLWPCRNAFGNPQHNYSYFMYDGIQTSININSSVLILDKETMNLKSYGQLNSPYCSRIVQSFPPRGNLACAKNRIFFQSDFSGNIRYPNQTLQAPNISVPGFCLNVFDYKGNMIEGVDYHSYSQSNRPGPIKIQDSVLYLCSMLASDANFGGVSMPNRGTYTGVIAKYVDTAFMTPYVAPAPHGGGERIDWVKPEECAVYPNPTLDKLTIKTDERVARVSAFSTNGIPTDLKINGNVVDVSPLPQGVYLIEIVTEKTKYYTKFIKK